MEATVEDLFLAGSETTATTLRWCAVLMLEHPDVQSRVQRELDDIIGRNRLPTLADRPNLPYTEAVIQEIARFATIAPIGAPHFTSVDTTFRGYKIPKDTMIIGNFWSISRDKKLWDDETLDEFQPERFLDENCNSVKKPEHHIVFGSGKRACPGEQLAKMEIYIFFTHMLHQFTMKKPTGAGFNDTRGQPGAVHAPFPFEVCLEPRKMAED
ncbi:cytochrome P450 2D6-like [Amphiura filiformis]|uniref:cytochrome P450 2D6-like n=1 Tax=Amphiura filiformis TaxID=82378 RepID=UPI003B22455E